MLYLGIDQHRKQLTVNLRNEEGDVILRRQVSTQWGKVKPFFAELQKQAEPQGGYMAILEVCGFNDWLLKMLSAYRCRETVVVQMESRSKRKTDRRDANALGELLWTNRHRLLAGQRVNRLRRVQPPSPVDAEARQVTSMRQHLATSAVSRGRRAWRTSGAWRPVAATPETRPSGSARSPNKAAARCGSCWGRWCCTCCGATSRFATGIARCASGAARRSPGWP
jgi:hypothetical protein